MSASTPPPLTSANTPCDTKAKTSAVKTGTSSMAGTPTAQPNPSQPPSAAPAPTQPDRPPMRKRMQRSKLETNLKVEGSIDSPPLQDNVPPRTSSSSHTTWEWQAVSLHSIPSVPGDCGQPAHTSVFPCQCAHHQTGPTTPIMTSSFPAPSPTLLSHPSPRQTTMSPKSVLPVPSPPFTGMAGAPLNAVRGTSQQGRSIKDLLVAGRPGTPGRESPTAAAERRKDGMTHTLPHTLSSNHVHTHLNGTAGTLAGRSISRGRHTPVDIAMAAGHEGKTTGVPARWVTMGGGGRDNSRSVSLMRTGSHTLYTTLPGRGPPGATRSRSLHRAPHRQLNNNTLTPMLSEMTPHFKPHAAGVLMTPALIAHGGFSLGHSKMGPDGTNSVAATPGANNTHMYHTSSQMPGVSPRMRPLSLNPAGYNFKRGTTTSTQRPLGAKPEESSYRSYRSAAGRRSMLLPVGEGEIFAHASILSGAVQSHDARRGVFQAGDYEEAVDTRAPAVTTPAKPKAKARKPKKKKKTDKEKELEKKEKRKRKSAATATREPPVLGMPPKLEYVQVGKEQMGYFRREGRGWPLFVVRQIDRAFLRVDTSLAKCTTEQATRTNIRTKIKTLKLIPYAATKQEIKILKDKEILGRRAPSCMLLTHLDTAKLLTGYGKAADARDLLDCVDQYILPELKGQEMTGPGEGGIPGIFKPTDTPAAAAAAPPTVAERKRAPPAKNNKKTNAKKGGGGAANKKSGAGGSKAAAAGGNGKPGAGSRKRAAAEGSTGDPGAGNGTKKVMVNAPKDGPADTDTKVAVGTGAMEEDSKPTAEDSAVVKVEPAADGVRGGRSRRKRRPSQRGPS